MNRIFFVTGVNGVGKTTVINNLTPLLGAHFEIYDFDERGVPDNVGRPWRLDETQYWIALGRENVQKNISTIICGFARPSEVGNDPLISFVLLDAEAGAIKQRLWNRYQTPESIAIIERVSGKTIDQFIQDNMNFSSVMREEANQYGINIVDTTKLNPQEVAEKVSGYIKQATME